VQDEEAATLLQGWGCDYIQGRLTGLAALSRSGSRTASAQPAAIGGFTTTFAR
jgi:hypothetical protein